MTTGPEFFAIFTAGVLSGIAALYGYRALVSRWIDNEPEPTQNGTWYYFWDTRQAGNTTGNVTELRPPSGPKGAA